MAKAASGQFVPLQRLKASAKYTYKQYEFNVIHFLPTIYDILYIHVIHLIPYNFTT